MPDPRQLGTDRLEQLAIELESQLHVERVGDEPAVLHDRDGIAKRVDLAVELVRVHAQAARTGGGGRNEDGVPVIVKARKSVGSGRGVSVRVDIGGRRIMKKKKESRQD